MFHSFNAELCSEKYHPFQAMIIGIMIMILLNANSVSLVLLHLYNLFVTFMCLHQDHSDQLEYIADMQYEKCSIT